MPVQPEEVRAWLNKAYADLIAAKVLIAHSQLALGPAAFHCQQAAPQPPPTHFLATHWLTTPI